jgi:3'-5' exoribonuclease
MSDPLHLPSLDVGHRVDAPLLVLEVDIRSTASGDPYTMLTLGNASGRIGTEPFWRERQEDVAGLRSGHIVHVVGEVGTFRDKRQLRVSSIRSVPAGAADLAAFLPTVGAVEKYRKTLDGWRREISAPRLRTVLDLFFEDEEFRTRFEACPAAVQGHHAALGGLLKHTTEVAAIARTVARTCGADPDVTLAGALLHDIGKLESYTWNGLFAFTDRGRLLGHVVIGAMMLEEAIATADAAPCTDLERDLLLHLILSHHGHLEFGSPVTPMTLEAEVLYWSDNASAKTASMADVLQDDESFPDGSVSTTQWTLDRRRAYRGRSDWGREGEG